MGYLLSDYTISLFPDNGTDYHPLYSDTTNSITYELIGVTPEELLHSAPVGFPAVYSICGALIKINNKYTPMVISTTSSGCRVRNDSTQEIGSYKQVKYNGYGYYVCDNIPGLADNITVQGYMLKEIDKNYNSIEEAVIDFLSRLDKLPTPCKRIYLLPEPTKKQHDYFSEYNLNLYNGNGAAFYAKPITSTEEWWAIGTVMKDASGYYHPIIISTVRDYAKLLDTQLVVNNSNIVEFEYNGFTYYINSTISQSILTKGLSTTIGSETIYYYSGHYGCCEFIPYDNSSEEKIIEMGKSLLAQYEFEGGKLKSVAGKISAIKDLDEKGNSRGKTFSRAHAKTVYTSLADNKTLDQDLKEIAAALLKLQSKSDITQTDIENTIKEKAWIYEYAEKISDKVSPVLTNKLIYLFNSGTEDRSNLPEDSGGLIYTTIYYGANDWLTYIQFYFSFETQKLYYRKIDESEEDTTLFTNSWNEVSNSSENVDVSTKMDKENAVGTGSFSLNRKANSEVGDYSVTLNSNNTASNNNTFAHGLMTVANGLGSHSEGCSSTASGQYSHAEGYYSAAFGEYSHAEGNSTYVYGSTNHAEGIMTNTDPDSIGSHAEGKKSSVIGGQYCHAEGESTKAKGLGSHAEGYHSEASGEYSHAEGYYSIANDSASHAEGIQTKATSSSSHAEGHSTVARASNAHAEGLQTFASGINSHSEGSYTEAKGQGSHAEGSNTIAAGEGQHVEGKYNIEDTENKYAHIIGGGSSHTARKNIHTVDWYGNAYYAGTITCKSIVTEGGSSVDISELIEYGNNITD